MARNVARLRQGLREFDLAASASLFPVQPLRLPGRIDAGALHEALLARGVRTVLHRGNDDAAARISFVVTARHALSEIDRAVACLKSVMSRGMRWQSRGGKGNGKSTKSAGEALYSVFGSEC